MLFDVIAMKRFLIRLLLPLVALVASCTTFPEEEVSVFSLSPSSLTIEASGGFSSVTLRSGTKWDVTRSASWLSVSSIKSGSNPFEWTVQIQSKANEGDERHTSLEFSNALGSKLTLDVTQERKPVVHVSNVVLDTKDCTLTKGSSIALRATVLPSDATDKSVIWSSSDERVVSVTSAGRITAVGGGRADVTVTTVDGAHKASCRVTVTVPVQSVSILGDSQIALVEGDRLQLSAAVYPEDATDKSLSWHSSDSGVVTVSDSGEITAMKVGNATVRATSRDNTNASSEIQVQVSAKPVPVAWVSVSPANLTMRPGDTRPFSVSIYPSDATDRSCIWSVSDTRVLSVDTKGLVTALNAGDATVKVSAGGKSASAYVHVVQPVTGITLSESSIELTEGESASLVATVYPSDAENKKVTWSTSNYTVATVTDGYVYAVHAGTATITVRSDDNSGLSATCMVTVNAATVSVTGVSLAPSSVELTEGQSTVLTASVYPSEATDKSLTWSSVDPEVATVDQNGKVTARGEGNTTVSVTSVSNPSARASCSVTVRKKVVPVTGISASPRNISLESGGVQTVSLTVSPSNATDKSLKWITSDPSVATLSSLSDSQAEVLAVGPGAATITISSVSSPSVWAELIVTVTEPQKTYAIPETVDLGLPSGILWANFNLGATRPEEYGDYFAWGETSVKTTYTSGNYLWNGNSKYSVGGLTQLQAQDDAAAVLLGPDWFIPTREMFEELLSNCYDRWTSENGVQGIRFTSKSNSSRSIFIPAAGYYRDGYITEAGSYVMIWSSTFDMSGGESFLMRIGSGGQSIAANYSRFRGMSVRPVSRRTRVAVTGVSLDKASLRLETGRAETLTAIIYPSNATNRTVQWASNNTSVATVSSDGTVTGVSQGRTQIVATTADGGFRAYCTIEVTNTPVGLEAVDLGLPSGIKWANMNLGAAERTDYGDYYAWGETEPYYMPGYSQSSGGSCRWRSGKESGYIRSSYTYSNGANSVSVYNGGYYVLDSAHDAATVRWGAPWRMPTRQELQELMENCSWEYNVWDSGVYGYKVTSKSDRSRFIIIPMAGYRNGTALYDPGVIGYYWTSTRSSSTWAASCLFLDTVSPATGSRYIYQGLPIRPVRN